MSYCTKCGKELKEGDNFCLSCGTPVNGVANDATQNSSEAVEGGSPQLTQNENLQNAASQASKYLNEAFGTFVSMLKKPISTIKYIPTSLSLYSTLVLAAILSVFSGLLAMWQTQKLYSAMEGALSGFSGGLFGASPFSYSGLSESAPYGKIFIYSLLGTIAFLLLLSLLLFLADKLILKKSNTFTSYLAINTAAIIPVILYSLVAIIISYVSISVALAVFLFGSTQCVLSVYCGSKELIKSDDTTLFTVAGSYALAIFIELLVLML